MITYAVLAPVSGCYPPLMGRFPTCYSPVRHSSTLCKQSASAFDLHVLGIPPAFVLSQDQTLILSLTCSLYYLWVNHVNSFVAFDSKRIEDPCTFGCFYFVQFSKIYLVQLFISSHSVRADFYNITLFSIRCQQLFKKVFVHLIRTTLTQRKTLVAVIQQRI